MSTGIKAALYQVAAMLSFSVMGALVKYTGGLDVSSTELVFFRGLVGMPIVLVLALRQKVSLGGKRKGLLLARGLAGTIGLFMFFYGLTQIPVANAVLLNQATPIFVLPMAVLFLGEHVTPKHVVLVALAIFGVMFVVKPGTELFSVPSLIALGSALFAAIAYVLVRKLTETESSLTIVFWFTAISTLASFSYLLVTGFSIPGPGTLGLVAAMGVFATMGQLLLTRAYRLGQAARLAVLGSLGAVFGAGWDLLIWRVLPDLWTLVGGVTAIVACTGIQVLRQSRTAPRYLSS